MLNFTYNILMSKIIQIVSEAGIPTQNLLIKILLDKLKIL